MSSPSNLYAEKIYAEQPNSLWALDEQCDFVSYFSKANLDISSWTGHTNTASWSDYTSSNFNSELIFPPMLTEKTVKFSATPTATNTGDINTVIITSPNTFASSLNSFAVGFYFYSLSASIQSVSINYTNSPSGTEQVIPVTQYGVWKFISTTFFNTITSGNAANLVISVNYKKSSNQSENYIFYINGLSIGNNSENFNSQSTGIQLTQIPASIAYSGYGIQANSYGSDQNIGWYIGQNTTTNKSIFAKNSTMPMVYGASNSTILYPNSTSGKPSLIVPGMGFMNDSGKYNTLAFECWIKVKSSATSAKRILGPIASTDGLYVNGPYMILKVGQYFQSHYVGDWFRPMLVQIELGENFATVTLNGEQVINMEISTALISFPQKYSGSADQDYIGFYAYSDIQSIEVDCIAIYPYRIASPIAKRRFAYGQAVVPPQNIETAYGGTQLLFDYTYANYSNNILYPDMTSWDVTLHDNVYTTSNTLSSPQHPLPAVILSNYNTSKSGDDSKWLNDLYVQNGVEIDAPTPAETNPFIKIRPNSGSAWSSVNGYLHIPKVRLSGMEGNPSAIYGVFSKTSESDNIDNIQILMKLQDPSTLDDFAIVLDGTKLVYQYNIGGNSKTIYYYDLGSGTKTFSVGIMFNGLKTYSTDGGILKGFLAKLSKLELFIGGDYSGPDVEVSTTFIGKIYNVSIVSKNNINTISSLFALSGSKPFGILSTSVDSNAMLSNKASYSLSMKSDQVSTDKLYYLDASSKSYWQDYRAVSSICQPSEDNSGNKTNKVSFVQFNIDYPATTKTSGNYFDTSSELVKTYVMFSTTTNPGYGIGVSSQSLPTSMIVSPGSDWQNKKYEVIDGAVIYMPPVSDQTTLAMTTIVEASSPAINKYPTNIRYMQYASQTFNSISGNSFDKSVAKPIGTRTGKAVYPYNFDGSSYTYSPNTPFSINKFSSPYLYLSNKSGIKILNSFGTSSSFGLGIQINPSATSDYNISSINVSMLFNDPTIPSSKMTLFSINGSASTGSVRIVLTRSNSSITNRGTISAETLINGTWTTMKNVLFYINGIVSYFPTIFVNEWVMLGILFLDTIDFSNYGSGILSINGSVLVNNLSVYRIDSTKLAQQSVNNSWNFTKNTYSSWGDVDGTSDSPLSWMNIHFSQSKIVPQITPKTIFEIYTGTNKFFANPSPDVSGIRLHGYQYSVYQGVTRQTSASLSA